MKVKPSITLLLLILPGLWLPAEEKPPGGARPDSAANVKKSSRGKEPEGGKRQAGKGQREEERKKKDSEEAKKDAGSRDEEEYVEVTRETFEKKVEIDGIIESQVVFPVTIDPEAWSVLQVIEAIPHGSRVEKGDVLIRLNTEDLRLAIEDLEASMPLEELKSEKARLDLEVAERTLPIRLEEARKKKEERIDDFTYFEEIEHPMNIRDEAERLKLYQNRLAYTEEELRQLEKMYESDDVTEETEEIILKRARDSVARDRWDLEQIEVSTERRLETILPREFASRKEGLKLRRIETAGQEESMHRDLEIKRLEVAKQERDLAKSRERLAHLRQDLEALVVKAPRDGIVYYGAVQRGKWVTAQAEEKKLVPGGSLTPGKVVMSLVDPDKLKVRLSIPETKMKGLKKGQKAVVTLKWNDDLEMDATIDEVIYVPQPDSTFTAVGSLDAGRARGMIFPGMNATVEVTTYRKPNAVVVPRAVIKEEGDKSYVTMKDGKRRWIELGQSSDKKQEVLKGLKEGEKIAEGEEKKDEPETK